MQEAQSVSAQTQEEKKRYEALASEQVEKAKAESSNIEDLAAEIFANNGDLEAALAVRKKELGEFASANAELASGVSTLGRATTIREKEAVYNPTAPQRD